MTTVPSLSLLTPPQAKLAAFILRFSLDNHYGPCVDECAEHLGIGQTAVRGHLDRLAKKGAIGRKHGVPRALWIPEAWAQALAPVAPAPAAPTSQWVELDPAPGLGSP